MENKDYQSTMIYKVMQTMLQQKLPTSNHDLSKLTLLPIKSINYVTCMLQKVPEIRGQMTITKKDGRKMFYLKNNGTIDDMYQHYEKWYKVNKKESKKAANVKSNRSQVVVNDPVKRGVKFKLDGDITLFNFKIPFSFTVERIK